MKKGAEDFIQQKTETLYNAGLSKIYRLDSIRKIIHTSRLAGDYNSWFEGLRCWRDEIQEKMKEEEILTASKFENDINFSLGEAERKSNNSKLFGVNINVGNNKVYSLLQDYGHYLGSLEHKYGLSMPNKADGRFILN